MATQVILRRNVVVLGKTGCGKSTVANKIAGQDAFEVSGSLNSVTSTAKHTEAKLIDEANNVEYTFKLVDTVGLFDSKRNNKDIIKEIKEYTNSKVPEGVSFVLFVFNKGRFTKEESDAFDFIIKNSEKAIKDISALVITGSEDLDKEGREKQIQEFRDNHRTKYIADFMGKGIYSVGFPSTVAMIPELKAIYENGMKVDAEKIRRVVMKCGEMRLGTELFQKSSWYQLTICTIS